MAITKAEWNMLCKVTETLDVDIDGTDNPVVVSETASDAAGTLTSSSAVPGTLTFSDTRELAAGTDTLDLSALTKGDLTTAVNMNGLKVQLFKVVAASTNTGNILIFDAAADGYNIFGHAAGEVTLLPGMSIQLYGNDKLDDIVTDTNDQITFTSADQDAGYDVQIVAG